MAESSKSSMTMGSSIAAWSVTSEPSSRLEETHIRVGFFFYFYAMIRYQHGRNIAMQLTTKEWWKAAGIRALKTVSQTAVAVYGTMSVVTTSEDIKTLVIASVTAGVLSILTSIAGLPELKTEETKEE